MLESMLESMKIASKAHNAHGGGFLFKQDLQARIDAPALESVTQLDTRLYSANINAVAGNWELVAKLDGVRG